MNKYLLMVDEIRMQALISVLPSLEFLEVQGMDLHGNTAVKILATPVKVTMPMVQPTNAVEEAPVTSPENVE